MTGRFGGPFRSLIPEKGFGRSKAPIPAPTSVVRRVSQKPLLWGGAEGKAGAPMTRKLWSKPTTALIVLFLLAVAPLVHAETVIQQDRSVEEDALDGNLDIVQVDFDDVIHNPGDGPRLDHVRIEMTVRNLNTTNSTQTMYAVEFSMDMTRYRVHANWSAAPRPVGGVLTSGWAATFEKKQVDQWQVVSLSIPFEADEEADTLTWEVSTDQLAGLEPGQLLEEPKAFTYLNGEEVDELEQTVKDLLSDQLDDDTGEGATVSGWSIVDIAPGGTGADWQTTEEGNRTYGDDHVVAPGLVDDGGDDQTTDDTTGDQTNDQTDNQQNDQQDDSDPNDQQTDGQDGDGTDSTGDETTDAGTAGSLALTDLILPLGVLAAVLVGIAVFVVVRNRGRGRR